MGTGLTLKQATTAEMEAAASQSVAVTPANQEQHASGIKGWVNFNGTNAVIRSSYNVTSVTRNSTGNYTVTWDVDFSSGNNVSVISTGYHQGVTFDGGSTLAEGGGSAGAVSVRARRGSTNYDPDHVTVIAIGQQ